MKTLWLPILFFAACGGANRQVTPPAEVERLAQAFQAANAALKAHDFETAGVRLDALQTELEQRSAGASGDLRMTGMLALVHQGQASRLRGMEATDRKGAAYCLDDVADPRAVAIKQHVATSHRLMRRACDRGSAESCANLGVMLLTDVCGDRKGVVEAYEKGCAGGITRACTELGNFYGQGQFVEVDPSRAKAYYQRACDGGDPTGCAHLGIAYDRGEGVEQDGARAAQLYGDACTAGSPVGCNSLGLLYQRGRHVEADLGRARALFETACAQEHPHACTRLGEFHLRGVAGLTADAERAAALFNRGCIARSAQGCFALGVMHERLMVEEADMAQATRLYSMACELGHPSGCFNIGNGYMLGDQLPQDFSKAIVFWQRACDGRHQRACMMVATHDENGPLRR